MKAAYRLGVRRFDISFGSETTEAARSLYEAHPDASFVFNFCWRGGILLHEVDLIDLAPRVFATLRATLPPGDWRQIAEGPPRPFLRWARDYDLASPFSEQELGEIEFDDRELCRRLAIVEGLPGGAMIGTDIVDWCALLGRYDIVEAFAQTLLAHRQDLVQITHWPDLVLPLTKSLPAEEVWIPGMDVLLEQRESEVASIITNQSRRVSIFGPLRTYVGSPLLVRESLWRALALPGVYNLVIGLSSTREVDALRRLLRTRW